MNLKEYSNPCVLWHQLEGGYEPLIYRHQPEGSYNSFNYPEPIGRRLQPPDLQATTPNLQATTP
jgi:hypothetical protein